MGQVIHYQDDIYLIDSLISFLADTARLDADAEILGDVVYSVILQADRAFRVVREMILGNSHLSDRNEYLALLARTATTMTMALDAFLKPGSSIGQSLELRAEELRAIRDAHTGAANEIESILDAHSGKQSGRDDHVSSDEISELLKG
ncbi:MAG: hypothetical protein KKI09_11920 [Spirochaetes bacterium]|nr:hypothetical protein [Spirochaetota bacterium]MBU0956127.1 hypothetical protein [Spirochaetota bacterium]